LYFIPFVLYSLSPSYNINIFELLGFQNQNSKFFFMKTVWYSLYYLWIILGFFPVFSSKWLVSLVWLMETSIITWFPRLSKRKVFNQKKPFSFSPSFTLSLSLSNSHTHTQLHTHTHTRTHILSLSQTHKHKRTKTHTLSFTHYLSLTHNHTFYIYLTLSLSHTNSLSLSPSLSLSLSLSLSPHLHTHLPYLSHHVLVVVILYPYVALLLSSKHKVD